MNNLAKKMTNQLELDMRAFGRELYNERRAFLFKIPEEMQQTPFDFFGFTPSGRAIAIECKQVKRKALPIGTSNGLQPHQWAALELAYTCNVIVLLVWRNGDETRTIGWLEMCALSNGRKSIEWPIMPRPDWRDEIRLALA